MAAWHKAAGPVYQWNSEKTVSKTSLDILSLSTSHKILLPPNPDSHANFATLRIEQFIESSHTYLEVCPVLPADVDGLGAELDALGVLLLLELDGRDVRQERHLIRVQLDRLREGRSIECGQSVRNLGGI